MAEDARAEAHRRWPDWVAPPPDVDPDPDYSEIDAQWQNAESEMQRSAFMAGAEWRASSAEVKAKELDELIRIAKTPESMLTDGEKAFWVNHPLTPMWRANLDYEPIVRWLRGTLS